MREPITIDWKQQMAGGMPLNAWFARVVHPVETVIFASVGDTLKGTWNINLTPSGRGVDKPERCIGPYKTREKAMSQVERWASYHWRAFPLARPLHHAVAGGYERR